MTVEIDRALIGQVSAPYVVEIEKGAVRRFADAIGDPNPVYRDLAAARAQGFAGIVAPPTFPASFLAPEEPEWTRHLDRRRVLAGEQSFHYARPILVGDVLTCRIAFVGVEDKLARSGAMELLTQEVRGTDAAGTLVYRHRRVTVYRAAPAG
ncbi:MaoC family dehydratase N-terminal domain-containing protein [Xanthobacter sp. KR7-225]|uniref:MaoC family dehydratase N-terminal domain-containing protein n=1 Tax=Xanthobacter sp. KR7-225 TaxID=3156613 RepID=UPI0032B3EAA0